jgi:hypothetical protein
MVVRRSDTPGAGGQRSSPQKTRPSTLWFAAIALLLAGALWYAFHPLHDKPWNNQAVEAHFSDLIIQRPQTEAEMPESDVQKPQRDVHIVLHYVLTNHTGKPYRIPPPSLGALMKNVTHTGLSEMDSVVWESPVIAAGKTAKVEFDLAFDPSAPGEDPEEIAKPEQLQAFCNRQLNPIQGLVFFDYANRYAIDLPRGWD